MADIIRLPQFLREAELRSGSYDEATNSMDVVFTTGAVFRRSSWTDGEFDEELVVNEKAMRLGRLNAGAPFLDSHASYSTRSILGSVVPGSARIEKGRGIARIQLTRREDALGTVQDIRDGVIRNVSVGYKTYVAERTERKGKIPLHRVTDWEPWEISAVAIPADTGAQVRSAEARDRMEVNDCMLVRSVADQNTVLRIRMELMQRQAGLAR